MSVSNEIILTSLFVADGEVITPRSAVTSDKDRSRDDGEIDDDDNNDIDNESLERERECKRKREKSGSKDSDREQSEKLDAQSTPSQPQEKEDTSRQVEGTVQKTVVVPAQGDRPSFDIKIVNPVVSTSLILAIIEFRSCIYNKI